MDNKQQLEQLLNYKKILEKRINSVDYIKYDQCPEALQSLSLALNTLIKLDHEIKDLSDILEK